MGLTALLSTPGIPTGTRRCWGQPGGRMWPLSIPWCWAPAACSTQAPQTLPQCCHFLLLCSHQASDIPGTAKCSCSYSMCPIQHSNQSQLPWATLNGVWATHPRNCPTAPRIASYLWHRACETWAGKCLPACLTARGASPSSSPMTVRKVGSGHSLQCWSLLLHTKIKQNLKPNMLLLQCNVDHGMWDMLWFKAEVNGRRFPSLT